MTLTTEEFRPSKNRPDPQLRVVAKRPHESHSSAADTSASENAEDRSSVIVSKKQVYTTQRANNGRHAITCYDCNKPRVSSFYYKEVNKICKAF